MEFQLLAVPLKRIQQVIPSHAGECEWWIEREIQRLPDIVFKSSERGGERGWWWYRDKRKGFSGV
jgi:hypothetical protein